MNATIDDLLAENACLKARLAIATQHEGAFHGVSDAIGVLHGASPEREALEAERRLALDELRASEARYRVLFEDAAEPMMAYRVDGERPGAIVAVNPAAAVVSGYTREELCQKTLFELTAPEARQRLGERIEAARAHGANAGETVLVKKDGTPYHVRFRTGLAWLGGERVALSIAHDVTEDHRAEGALRASEARYRLMFDNAGEAILAFAIDGADAGRILAANPAAADLTGYGVDELAAMTMAQLEPPAQYEAAAVRVAELIAQGRIEGESVFVRRDGEHVPVELRTSLTELGGRRVALIIGHDARARRQVQDALRAAKEAAEEANRAKSSFLANMSHEIRTPLNAILGYAQLLARDLSLSAEQRRYLRIIDRGGDHLLEMINDVLEMSKIEAGVRQVHPAPFDLLGMLDDVARMFQLRADAKRLAFALVVGVCLPREVVSDEGKLRQVVVNLLSNAIRLTPSGRVTLRVTMQGAGPGARELCVEVEDTGPGISEQELARLFQPFEQARAGGVARGGTGLGLALSRELVRLMGGEITVRSRVGVGSVFRVALPVTVVASASSAPDAPVSAAFASRVVGLAKAGPGPRVLVVDDDEHGRTWLGILLREIGFDVREAGDGKEGLDVFDVWGPDLVLMDLRMPGMDGFAAIREIRAREPARRPVIIAVTASAFEEAQDAIVAAGADAWLRKPCREGELLDAIARHLGVEYTLAEAPSSRVGEGGPTSPPLPVELAAALRDALRLADLDSLRALLAALPPAYASTAAHLGRLADAFAYDRIEALLS